MLRPCRQTIQILEKLPQTRTGAFACALTPLAASCTMNWARALSSAVRAFGLHPKGRPFKSDSAHHCDAIPFSGDVVQLVRTLPCHGRGREFESRRPRHFFQALTGRAPFSRGHEKAQNRYTLWSLSR